MEWNNILRELNYYLANLYITDFNHHTKLRLIKLVGLPAHLMEFPSPAVATWFYIMEFAEGRNKLLPLLELIASPEEGNGDDQFLQGAIAMLKAKKDVKSVTLDLSNWKGGNDLQLSREKIMGKKSTLLPIGFLENGTEAAKAVVRIVLGNTMATGFLIENSWLITNNHVLADMDAAESAIIEFGYQIKKGVRLSETKITELKAEYSCKLTPGLRESPLFETNKEEDWTLVKIDDPAITSYGSFKLSNTGVRAGDFVNIIQHPLGGPKQIGIYNNIVQYADQDIVQYLTDTNDGSSGSPVLNSDWEVVAVHHGGGWLMDKASGQNVKRNQGTNIERLKDTIKKFTEKLV
ncbi:trypsin-like serine peptidase [Chitinophaga pinensis]|uniref:Serine protease n=1 Tax=Chitinophaga pinensis (strain ATCC 43595 / DSM 2588 / LMG 13176 / NBRC 15968 / NCIMB 11800 / UQM 2034) TaxID=485918 RepID=A0A979G3S5_CHIPD|nr:serine protease [Chitinophaga pinensis]ACU60295.1 serine protease [Chitinophaga pinensis DSM 2588]